MLEPKDLLIANSTIIAGLLILLTIQSTTGENTPLNDWNGWQLEITKLEARHYALNQTLFAAYDKGMNSTSQQRADELQIHIDNLSTELLETTFLIEKMKQREIRIISDGIEYSLDQWHERPSAGKIMQTYAIVMMLPFVASSAIILGASIEKENKVRKIKNSIHLAKIITALGFVFILAALAIINYIILN